MKLFSLTDNIQKLTPLHRSVMFSKPVKAAGILSATQTLKFNIWKKGEQIISINITISNREHFISDNYYTVYYIILLKYELDKQSCIQTHDISISFHLYTIVSKKTEMSNKAKMHKAQET